MAKKKSKNHMLQIYYSRKTSVKTKVTKKKKKMDGNENKNNIISGSKNNHIFC